MYILWTLNSAATEAHDHDGLPHTLEHLVFMGSEEYPYKVCVCVRLFVCYEAYLNYQLRSIALLKNTPRYFADNFMFGKINELVFFALDVSTR